MTWVVCLGVNENNCITVKVSPFSLFKKAATGGVFMKDRGGLVLMVFTNSLCLFRTWFTPFL